MSLSSSQELNTGTLAIEANKPQLFTEKAQEKSSLCVSLTRSWAGLGSQRGVCWEIGGGCSLSTAGLRCAFSFFHPTEGQCYIEDESQLLDPV